MPEPTPSQTIGPYLRLGLDRPAGPDVVPPGTPGAILVTGTVYDGAGAVVSDGVVETWQADPAGRFAHPDDPRGAARPTVAGFLGFGRSCTDDAGRYAIRTVPPGALGDGQAPHLDVSVFARGLLDRVVTRIYLATDDRLPDDPVLASVPAERRETLVAREVAPGEYRFDIHLQGDRETVFFAL